MSSVWLGLGGMVQAFKRLVLPEPGARSSRWFAAGRRSPSTGRGAKQSEHRTKGKCKAKRAAKNRLLVLEHAVRGAAAAAPLLELGSQLHPCAKEHCQSDVHAGAFRKPRSHANGAALVFADSLHSKEARS